MSSLETPALNLNENALPSERKLPSLAVSEHLCDAATFKAPYPYRRNSRLNASHICSPQSLTKHVPGLYQPWTQKNTSPSPKPHILPPYREQHGWAEWRELTCLHPAWGLTQNRSYLSEKPRDILPPGLHPGYPLQPLQCRPVTIVTENMHGIGVEHTWEASTLRGQSHLNAERHTNERIKELFLKRRDRHMNHYGRGVWPSPTPLGPHLSPSPLGGHAPRDELTYKHQTSRAIKQPFSGNSPSSLASLRALPSDKSNNRWTSMGVKDISVGSPILSSSSSSPSDPIPWLLPHFAAGSLIKLRDGRLRRVEDLQTDDFLLGSLACPDLRLCYCTVQSIAPSASSSSLSRLIILLHGQLSQELVDVYVEYPFFVRGQGWSSCCPQQTARLCGLQCRQLSVGDVCLALTPLPTKRSPYPQPPPPALLEPLHVTHEKI